MSDKHRIMIIDDEGDILRVIKDWLLRWNFLVDDFSDPKKALDEFRAKPSRYSVVITDTRMPGISGIELARRMQVLDADVRVILMTAYEVLPRDLESLGTVRWEDVLHKPFKLVEVCNAIKKQLAVQC